MLRVLWHSAAPWLPTGYGILSDQITRRLRKLGVIKDLAWLPIGTAESACWERDGITLYPVVGGAMGELIIDRWVKQFEADIVISVTDHWVWKTDKWKKFRWIPIAFPDNKPIGQKLVDNLKMAHKTIVPTKWGEKALREAGVPNTEYIPLGIDTHIYKPDEEARQSQRQAIINIARKQGAPYISDDCFIFGMVARNGTWPARKGHDLVFDAVGQLLQRGHKNFLVYVHSMADGAHGGVDLLRMLNAYSRNYKDDRVNRHVLFPPPEQMHLGPHESGFPDERMASLYNAMDCFVNPSSWEGFGLTGLEAAGCGVPSIVTDVGCQPEIQPVGWKIPVYRRLYAPATDTFVAEPDLNGLVTAMEMALRTARKPEMRDKAARHGKKYDWDDIVQKQWVPFLEKIESEIAGGKWEGQKKIPRTSPRELVGVAAGG